MSRTVECGEAEKSDGAEEIVQAVTRKK